MAVWSQTKVSEISKSKRIDSEYFHPSYLEAENAVLKRNVKPLKHIGQFLIGPFGSAFHVSNYDLNSTYRYIRGKDVKPFQLLDDDSVYMPPRDFERLNRYSVKENDLLISVVGTLGNVAIVPEGLQGVFSCKSTVFRNSCIDPYFLLAYFNSSYGKSCLLRRQRGAIQAGLNKDDLEVVPVPIFDPEVCSDVGDKVRMALDKNRLSKSLYSEAQKLLEKELGLDQLVLEKPKSYEASFSEVVDGGRFDCEFFNPVVRDIYKSRRFNNSKPLHEIFSVIRGNTPAKYYDSGVPVLKTKNIRTPIIDEERVLDYVNDTSGCISPRHGDLILASMGVGSLGRLSYLFSDDTNFVIDGTLRILRSKNTHPKMTIPSMLYLTSKYGQEIMYSGIIGSTGIISLPDYHLKNMLIPVISEKLQEDIYDLVVSSYQEKKCSEQLLEQAKKMVEELIEGAV